MWCEGNVAFIHKKPWLRGESDDQVKDDRQNLNTSTADAIGK
jgi:hypothetical protein